MMLRNARRAVLVVLIIMAFLATEAFAAGKVHVKGYYRKDGTYVAPHYRSAPDGNPNNNYSSPSSVKSPAYDNSLSDTKSSGGTTVKSTNTSTPKPGKMKYKGKTYSRDNKGHINRDPKARADFMKKHPCPSTGKTSGSCPGYVVDHIVPLKRGGADDPSNMQWQTEEDAKAKDKWE